MVSSHPLPRALPVNTASPEPSCDEIWTELPIAPGQKVSELPGFRALTREGWLLASAFLSGTNAKQRIARLYLTRPIDAETR